MYRINYLKRPTLITPDEVLFHAATDSGVDERQLLQNIIVAEERIIAPAICDDFYEELIAMKNVEVKVSNKGDLLSRINASLAADGHSPITNEELPIGTIVNAIEFITDDKYKMLWNRFLWKITAEAVDMMSIVPSWLRHTSAGQQKNNPEVIGGNQEGSVTGDRKDIQFKLDIWMQDRIDPLIERMRLWICKNKTNFPKYCKKCSCDDEGGISVERKTDWIFNAYEEVNNSKLKI